MTKPPRHHVPRGFAPPPPVATSRPLRGERDAGGEPGEDSYLRFIVPCSARFWWKENAVARSCGVCMGRPCEAVPTLAGRVDVEDFVSGRIVTNLEVRAGVAGYFQDVDPNVRADGGRDGIETFTSTGEDHEDVSAAKSDAMDWVVSRLRALEGMSK